MTQPKYRDDIKGEVARIKSECVDTFRGEIANADDFIVLPEDATNTMREYADYLTQAELAQCFKAALRAGR